MTFNTERSAIGHEPLDRIAVDADSCANDYSVAPCTASGPAGSECYNTIDTCQDVINYVKTTKTYRFCSKHRAIVGETDIPAIQKVTLSPGIAEPGEIGVRSTLTITIADFPHNDRNVDPYVDTRSYDPLEQGTFWGRWIARNPYYVGRELRHERGYYTDPFDSANFQTRTFVIENISGPDRGFIKIKCKDRLKLADDARVQIPPASTGLLSADINDSVTAFSVQAGQGADYAASGTLRIGDEEMTFTRSTDAFTVVRAVNGTPASEHDQDDLVQEAKVWTAINVVDALHEILVDFVGIDETKIPYDAGLTIPTGTDDEWDDEKVNWLSINNLTRTVSEPTGAQTLISELLTQNGLTLWHDMVSDEIKLKATVPPLGNVPIITYSEDLDLIQNETRITREEKRRISEVWVYHGKINNTESDRPSNFRYLNISSDSQKAGDDQYGEVRRKVIFGSWVPSNALASQVAGRLVARYAKTPHIVNFKLHPRNGDLNIGDLCLIDSAEIQTAAGENNQELVQVISRTDGDEYAYKALTARFEGLFGFIGPDTLGDYLSESDSNKRQFAFISPDSGFFSNGDTAYKVI